MGLFLLVLSILKALWMVLSETINILTNLQQLKQLLGGGMGDRGANVTICLST